jgi:hypothetical protein
MADMVPSSRIAEIALGRAMQCSLIMKGINFPNYSKDEADKAMADLALVIELLGLIVPPPVEVKSIRSAAPTVFNDPPPNQGADIFDPDVKPPFQGKDEVFIPSGPEGF